MVKASRIHLGTGGNAAVIDKHCPAGVYGGAIGDTTGADSLCAVGIDDGAVGHTAIKNGLRTAGIDCRAVGDAAREDVLDLTCIERFIIDRRSGHVGRVGVDNGHQLAVQGQQHHGGHDIFFHLAIAFRAAFCQLGHGCPALCAFIPDGTVIAVHLLPHGNSYILLASN